MRANGTQPIGHVPRAAFRMNETTRVQNALAKVRDRFLSVLPARRNSVSRLLHEIEHGEIKMVSLAEARSALHKIAGTAKTLGFAALGDAARTGEEAIDADEAAAASRAELSARLREVLAQMGALHQASEKEL